jgi:hypothetical protein
MSLQGLLDKRLAVSFSDKGKKSYFVLKHKDIDVLQVDFDSQGYIRGIGGIGNSNHLPVGCRKEDGNTDVHKLQIWWNSRGIPKDREGLGFNLKSLSMNVKNELLLKSLGLSLTDHYWVCPDNSTLRWKDINFYENDFSRDIGNLFFGRKKLEKYNVVTPDVSSDGILPKYWEIINGKRVLIKGGCEERYQEPFNEVIASKINEILGINHVKYLLLNERDDAGNYFCMCENMTDNNTELVYASKLYESMNKNINDSNYKHYVDCCNFFGINDIVEHLDKMIIVDFLIANTDRHWNNFGLLRDSDTLEYKSVAPIYDCGSSLWNGKNMLLADRNRIAKSKCFDDTNYGQLKYVSDFNCYNSKNIGLV